jgi:hypothetical protein
MTTLNYRTLDTIAFPPELITFNDLLVEMVDWSGANLSDTQARNWRRSVMDAMQFLSMNRACEWRYYHTQARFITDESVSLTGYYDHTGGAYERLFTVTSGTIPDWAEFGRLYYDGTYYEVAQVKSSTQILLTIRGNAQVDIASVGSPVVFTLYRTMYPLPADFLRLRSVLVSSGKNACTYVSPDSSDYMEKVIRGSGTAMYYTITGNQKFPGSQFIVVSPKVGTATIIDLLYKRYARRLAITGFATDDEGTMIATAGQTTAVLTGTTLTDRHIGAVIRNRADTTTPESTAGNKPYLDQRIIIGYTGGTITVDRAWSTTVADKAYIISDPIDVAPHMLNALKATCKKYVARSQPREAREIAMLDNDANYELTLAMEADRAYDSGWQTPVVVDRIHMQA